VIGPERGGGGSGLGGILRRLTALDAASLGAAPDCWLHTRAVAAGTCSWRATKVDAVPLGAGCRLEAGVHLEG